MLIINLQDNSLEVAARETIRSGIKLYRDSEGLLFHLLKMNFTNKQQGENFNSVEGINLAGKEFLKAHQNELRVKDLDKALYILSSSVLNILYDYLITSPQEFDDETITEELVDLIIRYLCK